MIISYNKYINNFDTLKNNKFFIYKYMKIILYYKVRKNKILYEKKRKIKKKLVKQWKLIITNKTFSKKWIKMKNKLVCLFN